MAAMPSASSFAANGHGEYLMDLPNILFELENAEAHSAADPPCPVSAA